MLLARLNADQTLAGEEYEKLRKRLIYFFERKGCRIAAELGDETINRVARKIEEGIEIRDMLKYSSTVARLVLKEHWDDPKREWEQIDEQQSPAGNHNEESDDRALDCMKNCLHSLPEKDQELMVKNCTSNKQGKLEIANSEGISINALRLKVFRIRTRLNECYQKCIGSISDD